MGDTVQVFYATDINYVTPTAVSIVSLLENCDPGRNYNVNVLVDSNTVKPMERVLDAIKSKFGNLTYKIIQVMEEIKSNTHIDHITVPTYYRLYITKYVDYDRCVYIDSDTVVTGDIGRLFDLDIGGKFIAGVKPACYYFNKREIRWRSKMLNIPVFDQYVNAGVLVFDLKRIRDSGMDDRLIEASKSYPDLNDQDLINMVYYGYIGVIDTNWNLMTGDYTASGDRIIFEERAGKVFGLTELNLSDITVIHYADRDKPWCDVPDTYPLKNVWYEYYEKCKSVVPNELLPKLKMNGPLPKKSMSERIKLKLSEYYDWLYNRIM